MDSTSLQDIPAAFADSLKQMRGATHLAGSDGQMHPVQTETGLSLQSAFELFTLVKRHSCAATLETGLAYGISTIAIMTAQEGLTSPIHVAIDPFQHKWHGIGIEAVRRAGYSDRFEFIHKPSYSGLAGLLDADREFDLVFIDGDHRFDGVVIDIALSLRLLKVGGLLVVDDLWMPSARAAISFARNNLPLEPVAARSKVLAILRKTAPDDRPWDHFIGFNSFQPNYSAIRNYIKSGLCQITAARR